MHEMQPFAVSVWLKVLRLELNGDADVKEMLKVYI